MTKNFMFFIGAAVFFSTPVLADWNGQFTAGTVPANRPPCSRTTNDEDDKIGNYDGDSLGNVTIEYANNGILVISSATSGPTQPKCQGFGGASFTPTVSFILYWADDPQNANNPKLIYRENAEENPNRVSIGTISDTDLHFLFTVGGTTKEVTASLNINQLTFAYSSTAQVAPGKFLRQLWGAQSSDNDPQGPITFTNPFTRINPNPSEE